MSITITIPGVDCRDGVAGAARALAPLATALLLPVLEEAVPGLGVALAVTRLVRLGVSVGNDPVR
ncbi:hypothetical protein [Pseudonocardia acidicola]|uniref:Uncharacterized protein n=1 Tax=Pseudonocardia acidicola TaxID=2724939 RepID=A0ABX1SKZ0_9PSEU|nr:hypothetical protein [Pseudonocardia acidicola]NMI02250.1 hypothetical protein [Pseudonocardia acidicola]